MDILYKITSRKWWCWVVTTVITAGVLRADGDHAWITPVIIVWGVVSVLFFAGETLVDAINEAVKKADIKLGAGK
jgi:hypothetical protein